MNEKKAPAARALAKKQKQKKNEFIRTPKKTLYEEKAHSSTKKNAIENSFIRKKAQVATGRGLIKKQIKH